MQAGGLEHHRPNLGGTRQGEGGRQKAEDQWERTLQP